MKLDYTDYHIKDAMEFSRNAHGNQLRKWIGTPYYLHPLEVAELVASVGGSRDAQIAALLHDVVEDTEYTIEKITHIFGFVVGYLVSQVTDVSNPEDGNRVVRKKMDRDHLSKASPEAQTVKLADLISNTQSILTFNPNFAKVYLVEKRELLGVLTKGNQDLQDMAWKILESSENFLNKEKEE